MSVTSSGRSSISSTISTTSGWLAVMELANDCSSIVLPVRAGRQSGALAPLRASAIHHPAACWLTTVSSLIRSCG